MKKIVSFLLIGIMTLSLVACGGGSASSGSASSKAVKSSLKGDFMFYKKSDGVYFTDNNDIPETLLTDKDVCDIYIDEKNKNIVFTIGYGYGSIYIKSFKNSDEEVREIGNYETYNMWNDKKIIWRDHTNNSIFIYDLDSKKTDRIAENVGSDYKVHGDKITYFECSKDNINKVIVYNIKSNSKKERDIGTSEISEFADRVYAGDVVYFLIGTGNKASEQKIYKVTIDNDPVVVAEVKKDFIDAKGYEGKYYHRFELVDAFSNGELYYKEMNDARIEKGFTSKEDYPVFEYKCYCYDGNNNKELGFKDINSIVKKEDRNSFRPDVPIVKFSLSGHTSTGGFFVNNKAYDGKYFISISTDGSKILFYEKDGNEYPYTTKVLNIKNDEITQLDHCITHSDNVSAFDNINLLYLADNDDLVLNDSVIDYKVKNKGINSPDFSTIIYRTGDGALNVWKDDTTNFITNNANNCYISNNNNPYYKNDDKLYLYKENESILIADGINEIYNYNIYR